MDKKYIIASSFVAFAVLLLGTTMVSATFGGNRDFGKNLTPEQKQEMQGKRAEMKAQMEERRAEMDGYRVAMQEAMEKGDYNAWKVLIEEEQAKRVNILDVVTKDNFAKFVEMHQLMEDKDFDGAKAIADELGLPGIGMRGHGIGMKMGHFKNIKN